MAHTIITNICEQRSCRCLSSCSGIHEGPGKNTRNWLVLDRLCHCIDCGICLQVCPVEGNYPGRTIWPPAGSGLILLGNHPITLITLTRIVPATPTIRKAGASCNWCAPPADSSQRGEHCKYYRFVEKNCQPYQNFLSRFYFLSVIALLQS